MDAQQANSTRGIVGSLQSERWRPDCGGTSGMSGGRDNTMPAVIQWPAWWSRHILPCQSIIDSQYWLQTWPTQCFPRGPPMGVSNTKPHSIWLIVLHQPWTSPADSDCALPVVTNFLCHVTNSAHLVVGPSLSLDQWLGIRCRLTSVIWRVVKTFLFAKY